MVLHMAEPLLNPGSWEVKFIEAAAELLRLGWTDIQLMDLVFDVADAEQVFSDEAEPA
jgi:hypothetical protein